nr:hypothetical protein [Tanacetum cinerariifolium]
PTTTVAAAPRLIAAAKGKQRVKAKSPTDPSEVARTEAEQLKIVLQRSRHESHISQLGGSNTDEGTEDIESGGGDDEETESDGESEEEETRGEEEESFDPILKTPEDSEDDGNGEEDQGLRVSEEQRLIEEEEADELYRDFAEAVSNISGIVHQYMNQQMTEAVREAVQIQTDRI